MGKPWLAWKQTSLLPESQLCSEQTFPFYAPVTTILLIFPAQSLDVFTWKHLKIACHSRWRRSQRPRRGGGPGSGSLVSLGWVLDGDRRKRQGRLTPKRGECSCTFSLCRDTRPAAALHFIPANSVTSLRTRQQSPASRISSAIRSWSRPPAGASHTFPLWLSGSGRWGKPSPP